MTKGEGQGWHRQTRRHSEAAKKGARKGGAPARIRNTACPPKADPGRFIQYWINALDYRTEQHWDRYTDAQKAEFLAYLDALASYYLDVLEGNKRMKKNVEPASRSMVGLGPARSLNLVDVEIARNWDRMTKGDRHSIYENLDMMHEDYRRKMAGEERGYIPTREDVEDSRKHMYDYVWGSGVSGGSIFD